jgi:hypothetical protein
MTTVRDLSGNGKGVVVEPHSNVVDISATDYTVLGKTRRVRVTGAGNLIYRPAGGDADITVAALAGESFPIRPGAVIRRTGTTATGMVTTDF